MPRIRLVSICGPVVGRGHANRMIALATSLTERHATVELELLSGVLAASERVRADRAGLVEVPAHSHRDRVDFTVLDLPDSNEEARRSEQDRLLVFDDRNVFSGRAAVVVQPSQPSWSGGADVGSVLAGYRYVPIDAAYRLRRLALMRGPSGRRQGGTTNVVACFGGSDPADVTGRVATALFDVSTSVQIIVGPSYQGSLDHGIPVIRDPIDLPDRLAGADVAVIGAGTMKFEAACVGRPAMLLAVADDQLDVGPLFADTGAATYVGDGRTIDPALLAASVTFLLADVARQAAMSRIAAMLVDGEGGDRVATTILSLMGADPT